MITLEKLKQYDEYDGFYDGFYVQKVKTGKNIITNEEWQLLNELVQDIQLVVNGLTSKEFAEKISEKLVKYCDNEKTINDLKITAIRLMK